jgi:hypothetical protein
MMWINGLPIWLESVKWWWHHFPAIDVISLALRNLIFLLLSFL